jgi:hypothetical protein
VPEKKSLLISKPLGIESLDRGVSSEDSDFSLPRNVSLKTILYCPEWDSIPRHTMGLGRNG